ncbi:MAG: hypothetical protein ACHQ2E_02895 [Gemmatimonadales bacterium]
MPSQTMLRVQLPTGEETVFRDVQEFERAIRQRVVTEGSRIFHARSGQWVPVQQHPVYRSAVAQGPALAPLVIDDAAATPTALLAPTPRYAEPRQLAADPSGAPQIGGEPNLLILLLAIASVAALVALAFWRPWEALPP